MQNVIKSQIMNYIAQNTNADASAAQIVSSMSNPVKKFSLKRTVAKELKNGIKIVNYETQKGELVLETHE